MEVFYGGSAGPGKSDALLMAALQYVDRRDYAALLIRKDWGMLSMPGALVPRMKDWLDQTDAHWAAGTHTWHFPSGATITFGHLQTPAARARYQSAEFQYVGIDECTDLDEQSFSFLFSRLRRAAASDVPLRFRSASNPTGPGRVWAKRRYVDDATREHGAMFVPAHLRDNPHVDQDAYIEALRKTHPITYQRLLNGDWEISESGLLFRASEWLADHRVPADAIDPTWPSVRYWDLAATQADADHPDPDWTCGLRMHFDRARPRVIISDVTRFRCSSGERDQRIRTIAETDGHNTVIGIEQEPGSSGKSVIAHLTSDVLFGYTVRGDRPTGPKEVRAQNAASAMQNGQVDIVAAGWNAEFIAECDSFDGTGETHDDQVDTLSGGFKMLTQMSAPVRTSGRRAAQASLTGAGGFGGRR